MTVVSFILLIIIAAVCGSIGQALAGYSRGGCLVSIFLGFIGAYLGLWLAQQLGLPEIFTVDIDGRPFPIVWSIFGAGLVAALFGMFSRTRLRRS